MTEAFRVGLTRDFLREDGTIGWGEIGLAALDEASAIEWEFLPERRQELTAEQVGSYDALIVLAPGVGSAAVACEMGSRRSARSSVAAYRSGATSDYNGRGQRRRL